MTKKQFQNNCVFTVQLSGINALTKILSARKTWQEVSNLPMIAVVLVSSLLLASCSSTQQQPSAPATAPAQQPKATVVLPKPVQKQASSVMRLSSLPVNQLDFSNKKDPFKPFVAVKIEPKTSPETIKRIQRNSLPIHSFDVNQFKLIGIVTGGRENQAMVTDPGGKGYVLKVGMLIGKNDGKIISISSSGVDVLEQFKDDNGRVRKENIKLTLPRKQ
jgi:type IV pilus assembly protein PilP